MARTAYVEEDECIACGLCVDNLPEAFRFADNGKAECYDSEGATEDDIQEKAIDVCPVSCIHWQD